MSLHAGIKINKIKTDHFQVTTDAFSNTKVRLVSCGLGSFLMAELRLWNCAETEDCR